MAFTRNELTFWRTVYWESTPNYCDELLVNYFIDNEAVQFQNRLRDLRWLQRARTIRTIQDIYLQWRHLLRLINVSDEDVLTCEIVIHTVNLLGMRL